MTAQRAVTDALTAVQAEDWLGANTHFQLATEAMSSLDESVEGIDAVRALQAELQRTQAGVQSRIDEAIEAEAARLVVVELCGAEAPQLSPWDGGSFEVERFVKETAHDPSSVEVSRCTQPRLTDKCWELTCDVRGRNAFGAMVLDHKTFYVGHVPGRTVRRVIGTN